MPKLTNENTENALLNAFKEGDENSFQTAMESFANNIQKAVLKEARNENADMAVMNKRGSNVLTSQESKFYNSVINNKDFSGVDELVPKTIFERVFEDLIQSHPLLSKIEFVNVTGVAEFITSRGVNPAWWGKLCEEIKEVLDNGFDVVNLKQYKLSGFMPACKAMLDLGPEWLDRYVRTVLVESLKIALEAAIIDGTGKDQPVGMMRMLNDVTDGVHNPKKAEKLSKLDPSVIGPIMGRISTLKVGDKKYYRTVNPDDVLFIVNPADYWSTLYPAMTVQNANGAYITSLPVPFTIIQSVAVPVGKAVIGLAKDYFMGIGSELKFAVSDEYKFIEDQRIYLAKQYGNGQPKSDDSFIVFDISGLTPNKIKVPNNVNVTAGTNDAKVSAE